MYDNISHPTRKVLSMLGYYCFLLMFFLLQPATVPPISELGPDALLEPMTIDEFINSLSNRKTSIKALLLDQVNKPLVFL